ncbi:MAG: phosphatase PAP2 family protein [Roseibium sp.]|nr:phosphatase PAP2 family protein [Roseibium sp.]
MSSLLDHLDIRRAGGSVLDGLKDPLLWLSIPVLALVTYFLAETGLDAAVNDLARHQNEAFSLSWSAFPMLAGLIAPMLIPIAFALKGNSNLASATLGAFVLSLLVVSLLKGFSSRIHPEAIEPVTSLARSRVFRFGVLEAGFLSIVEGWPSGHTATNGAVCIVIARLCPGTIVSTAALLWFVWVALATVFGINGDVHWLSDTVAGTVLALIIGRRIASALDVKTP